MASTLRIEGFLLMREAYRLYHETGKWKFCRRTEALELLAAGRWHDKTVYQPNEEALNYGNTKLHPIRQQCELGSEHNDSEGKESEHKQHKSNNNSNSRKKGK